MSDMVEMKLVGAATFSSPKVKNRENIVKGQVVEVPPDVAEYLAGLTYLDAANNEFPLFVRKGQRVMSRAVREMQESLDNDEDEAPPRKRRTAKA